MKTTVELSGALLAEAKKQAIARGTTLRELIERGLEYVLKEESARQVQFVLRDASVGGQGISGDLGWPEIREAIYEGQGG